MAKFPLPELSIENHTALLGKTGSGKTSTGKLIVEHVVDEGHRVCILDPIKSDWWGLTSSASGKRSGLPFEILGGPRGYVPLHATSGKVIGELVATGKLPLSILDMAFFKAGEQQRFFIDFAETLMRKMKGVLYLVIEEAHEFAPKEKSGVGNESMATYWAKKLATAGRSKGLRIIFATQRTQALHNALLGSCETMVVHRMTAPADQEPVKKWLKGNVTDKEIVATIDASMAKLPTGCAWVVSGEADFFEQVAFPLFRTFDNSAAPKKGAGADVHVSATYDAEALRELIGLAVEEADANDPAKLRARVQELEKQLKAKPPAAELDAKAISGIEQAAEARGYAKAELETRAAIAVKLTNFAQRLTTGEVELPLVIRSKPAVHERTPVPAAKGHAPSPVKRVPEKAESRKAAIQFTGLDGGQTKVMEALALCASTGDTAPTRAKVSVFSGYTLSGGRFGNILGSLRSAGLIEYRGDTVVLTEAGRDVAPEPDTSVSVRERLAPLISPTEAKVFDAIPSHGLSVLRTDVAETTGYEPTGGRFGNLLGRLRTLGLVEYPDAQHVRRTAIASD